MDPTIHPPQDLKILTSPCSASGKMLTALGISQHPFSLSVFLDPSEQMLFVWELVSLSLSSGHLGSIIPVMIPSLPIGQGYISFRLWLTVC